MKGRSKIKISNKKGKMIVKIMVFVIVVFNIIYFEINAQNSFCNTPSNIPDALSGIYPLASASNTYVVRIAVHLVRKSNGIGGLNYNQLNIALNYLKSAFEPHGICFSLYKINEIWDDNVYYNANLGQLKILNSTPNAIDIYLNDSTQWNQGQADNIPSKAFLVGGSFINSSLSLSYVIAHEMGHCLGLYHTFHGLCEYGGCAELPNGSNCNTCGDYVCDTPADPQIFEITEIGGVCSWNGSTCSIINAGYSPDPYNIMAYTPPPCMKYFTTGQGQRMRNHLANANVLQPVIVPNNYTLQFISFSGNQNVLYDVIEKLTLKYVYSNILAPGQASFRAGEEVITEGESQLLGESEIYIDTICNVISEINNAKMLYARPANQSINNISETTSSLFPNPTSSLVHFQLPTRIENTYILKITNLFGQSLSLPIQKLSDTMISIDFSNVAEGVYIVHYSDNEGNVFTNKVVVKR